MWTLLRSPRIPSSELQMPEIERSWGWPVAAAILATVFVTGLRPGVKFHSMTYIRLNAFSHAIQRKG